MKVSGSAGSGSVRPSPDAGADTAVDVGVEGDLFAALLAASCGPVVAAGVEPAQSESGEDSIATGSVEQPSHPSGLLASPAIASDLELAARALATTAATVPTDNPTPGRLDMPKPDVDMTEPTPPAEAEPTTEAPSPERPTVEAPSPETVTDRPSVEVIDLAVETVAGSGATTVPPNAVVPDPRGRDTVYSGRTHEQDRSSTATPAAGEPATTQEATGSGVTSGVLAGDSDPDDSGADADGRPDPTLTTEAAFVPAAGDAAGSEPISVAAPRDTSPATPPPPPHQQISTVLEAPLRRGGEGVQRIRIALRPDELGDVDLDVELHADGELHVHLAAHERETVGVLKAALGDLRSDLEREGFAPGRFGVSHHGDGTHGARSDSREDDRDKGRGTTGRRHRTAGAEADSVAGAAATAVRTDPTATVDLQV